MGTTVENADKPRLIERIMELHDGDDPHDKQRLRKYLETLDYATLERMHERDQCCD